MRGRLGEGALRVGASDAEWLAGEHLEINISLAKEPTRPHKSIMELKNYRDTLAHRKPREIAPQNVESSQRTKNLISVVISHRTGKNIFHGNSFAMRMKTFI